jgi:hypothetical protein
MPQVFHPSMNTVSRVSIYGAVFIVVGAFLIGGVVVRSPYATGQGVVRDQPVQFSHQHHVDDCGIDCRYCHTGVETSAFAGIPSTEICMNCHAYLWSDSPELAPVLESYRSGTPLKWTRVHNMQDFVFFNHSIHVQKGIGCDVCHGPVHRMPLMWQHERMQMEWCLDCHRNPERHVRPRGAVFDTNWQHDGDIEALRSQLAQEYDLKVKTDCSICHR